MKQLIGLLFCFIFVVKLSAQPVSPFNKLTVKCDSSTDISFIVTGHLHGASSNHSGFPASSLLANLDTINKLNPHFIISLGDLFLDVNEKTVTNYNRSFFNKLKVPFFNAPGNHDKTGNYKELYGETNYFFICKNALFIFLDTEEADGNIEGKRLKMLEEQLNFVLKNSTIKNIFISSHRPIWSENHPLLNDVFKGNTRSMLGVNNFQKKIKPLLNKVQKPVYWFSGSMGGTVPASFFYHKEGNITYIATAIRDLPRDAILKASIDSAGGVKFQTISLNGQPLNPLESYNLPLFSKEKKQKPPFNYRLLPYIVLRTLQNNIFWKGFLSCGLLITMVYIFFRKKR